MLPPAPCPANRPRRLRQAPWIRSMVAENVLSPADFIWPCFVIDGEDRAEPIASMPGVERLTIDRLVAKASEAHDLGIPAIAIFPNTDPSLKTPGASPVKSATGWSLRTAKVLFTGISSPATSGSPRTAQPASATLVWQSHSTDHVSRKKR